jgi:hypothetical protein
MQVQKFVHAGEKSWQARYAFDFAKLGLPGATAGLSTLKVMTSTPSRPAIPVSGSAI